MLRFSLGSILFCPRSVRITCGPLSAIHQSLNIRCTTECISVVHRWLIIACASVGNRLYSSHTTSVVTSKVACLLKVGLLYVADFEVLLPRGQGTLNLPLSPAKGGRSRQHIAKRMTRRRTEAGVHCPRVKKILKDAESQRRAASAVAPVMT